MSIHDHSALSIVPPALLRVAPLHIQLRDQLLGRFQVPPTEADGFGLQREGQGVLKALQVVLMRNKD